MAEKRRVLVCTGTGCASSGAGDLLEVLQEEIERQGIREQVSVVSTGCHGFCEQGPTLIIEPRQTLYTQVKLEDVPEIVARDLVKGEIVEARLYQDPLTQKRAETFTQANFLGKQVRIVLKNCGFIDPENIADYVAQGGYVGLAKALDMPRETVIEEVKRAGLRGRGGAGFPTGMKWGFCRSSPGEKKYVICNADEGDPGAFMDRGILEGDPHSVIEGMLIGAYAIGADEGYVYCRAEYPLAIKNMKTAIVQAEAGGYLGRNILGSDFHFQLKIRAGAGAFVCGEETALMASIEGRRGMPNVRPPFPAQSGLWGMPTNINNVETWSNVPHILRNGAGWYGQFGTEKSKGTKIFALTGKINNTGLVEVPMGTTLRDILFDIGGGVLQDKRFKAVQIGGPSGGCLPKEMLELEVDYDTLTQAGAMVGSGGLVVMDEGTCMVDIARFFLDFSRKESCGKCTPCREGNKRMWDILDRITRGEGKIGDLDVLENLAKVIKDTSLCGLGQNSPNPILAALKYFREEFVTHIQEGRCPARVCTDLLTYSINGEKCKGCGLCAKHCPANCISGEKGKLYTIDRGACVKCGACLKICKFNAVMLS